MLSFGKPHMKQKTQKLKTQKKKKKTEAHVGKIKRWSSEKGSMFRGKARSKQDTKDKLMRKQGY